MFALIPSQIGTTYCNWQILKDNVYMGEIEFQGIEDIEDPMWCLLNANKEFMREFDNFCEAVCTATAWL